MPKEVEKKCLQELKKLKNMSPMSAEANCCKKLLRLDDRTSLVQEK
jgi:ATP-dependent Lon protease